MNDFLQRLEIVTQNYLTELRSDFEAAVKGWNAKVALYEEQSVIGGLLARQCVLGSNIIRRYDYWDNLIGPFMIRPMLELSINMTWISMAPAERAKNYIDYGLGQSKLVLEYTRNLESIFEASSSSVDAEALWLNAQRHEMFTDVNVGQWSGISLDQMSQEAGIPGFYKLYSFMSTSAHGSWDHVFQFFLNSTDVLSTPQLPHSRCNPNVLFLAAQNVEQAFKCFATVSKQAYNQETRLKLIDNFYALRRAR